jgi:hypothetical protein
MKIEVRSSIKIDGLKIGVKGSSRDELDSVDIERLRLMIRSSAEALIKEVEATHLESIE